MERVLGVFYVALSVIFISSIETSLSIFQPTNICEHGHGFDSQQCIPCPPGTFSDRNDSICYLVPPGTQSRTIFLVIYCEVMICFNFSGYYNPISSTLNVSRVCDAAVESGAAFCEQGLLENHTFICGPIREILF